MIHRLYDEAILLCEIKVETIGLIKCCNEVEPIKKLLECHEIVELTLEIYRTFPPKPPKLPECDEFALLHLRNLTRELWIGYHPQLPMPAFPSYVDKIVRLLTIYQIPREQR